MITKMVLPLTVRSLTGVDLQFTNHASLPCRKKLTADKWGIQITSDPAGQSGKVQFTVERLRESFILRFHILNKGTACIHFTYYTALHKMSCFTLEDERRVTRACPLFLCPGESTATFCFHWQKNTEELINVCSSSRCFLCLPQERATRFWFGTSSATLDIFLPQCTLSSARICQHPHPSALCGRWKQ